MLHIACGKVRLGGEGVGMKVIWSASSVDACIVQRRDNSRGCKYDVKDMKRRDCKGVH